MAFSSSIDHAVHDHQQALQADARRQRLARSAKRARRRPDPPAGVVPHHRSEATDALVQLAEAAAMVGLEPGSARVLVAATSALEAPADAVGLPPLPPGTPAVAAQRWLGRLAERGARLDAAEVATVADLASQLRSVVERTELPAPAAERIWGPARARRVSPVGLGGAC